MVYRPAAGRGTAPGKAEVLTAAMSCPCPYADLYIYRIEGRWDSRAALGGQSFLGHWQEEGSNFLFFAAPAEAEVRMILSRQPQLSLLDSCHMPYDQWQGAVFTTEPIGRFCIVPAWENPEPADADDTLLRIVLDPGVVFGAGNHPTTRDCLQALDLLATEDPAGTVLDLGTGTGILALAAARLGSPRVLAVDLNLLAARTAARNVRLNQLAARILVVQSRAEETIDCPADLVVANLHGEVLLRLVDTSGFRQKQRFILSGLLRGEAKEMRRRLSRPGIRIVEEWVRDGIWHTFYGIRA
jgi:ribosomal protein L11 methyltransferase